MSPYHKKQKEKRRKNLFRKWHRRVGFAAAIFLVNLAVTGVLLNHSESLELHKRFVDSDWLVDWYGIKAPDKALCYDINESSKQLCQIGEKRILENQIIVQNAPELIGISFFDKLYYVASREQISLYTEDWSLVETIEKSNGLPTPISRIGTSSPTNEINIESYKNSNSGQNAADRLVVTSGQQDYIFNPEEFTWVASQNSSVKMNVTTPSAKYSLSQLQSVYLDNQINYLKLVQDLHSGRIIDSIGKWVTDIVAIIIILLAMSGFFAWQKRTKN